MCREFTGNWRKRARERMLRGPFAVERHYTECPRTACYCWTFLERFVADEQLQRSGHSGIACAAMKKPNKRQNPSASYKRLFLLTEFVEGITGVTVVSGNKQPLFAGRSWGAVAGFAICGSLQRSHVGIPGFRLVQAVSYLSAVARNPPTRLALSERTGAKRWRRWPCRQTPHRGSPRAVAS